MPLRIASLLVPILIAFVTNNSDGADKQPPAKLQEVRQALEAGKKLDALPAGVVLRISAELDKSASPEEMLRAGEKFPKPLNECWEFTSGHVHQVVINTSTKQRIYRRFKSRLCASKQVWKDLLDGKALTIEAAEGEGDPIHFVGTDYNRGARSIELLVEGKNALLLCESCFFAGLPESDARAFATLYEKLAKRARKVFVEKPVRSN